MCVPHLSVLANWEYVKRTISARADGAVGIGREAVPVGSTQKLGKLRVSQDKSSWAIAMTGAPNQLKHNPREEKISLQETQLHQHVTLISITSPY
jgi:hypothetical protein